MGLFDRFERFLDDVLFLPEDVREGLEAGDRALEAELFPEAASVYRDVLESRPQLPRALVGLAHALRGMGDHVGTLDALAQARRVLPEDDELALWTARLALELDDADQAAAAARDAAQLRAAEGGAGLAEACALAASAEWRRGRPDRAARELRKAISSDPTRHDLQVNLAYALADAGLSGAARSAAVAAPAEHLSATERRHLGALLERLGDPEHARPLLDSALADGDAAAGLVLARAAIRDGRFDEAELQGRRAVASGLGAEALGVLGDALAAAGRFEEATEALAAAADAGNDDALDQALRVAPRAALDAFLDRFGPRVEARVGAGVVAELRAFARGEDVEAPKHPRGHLARAHARLEAGGAAEALVALDAWEASRAGEADVAEATDLRRSALRALWRADGDVDLAAAIDAVARFGSEHGLELVARQARALRDELDRPLLLAFLGEFNAGKSTLINAFIGAEVAPMGIVPTTATLNVLRGGAERIVRVVLDDGSTREGDYAQLGSLLDAAARDGVDHVEIVLPSERLERVWILDAPGTNALDAAHEALAKEAARRADAVLWIFDAAQAGKLTETRMHEELRARGRLVVPVLNKTDRLKPGELEEVSALVTRGFGARPRAVSARAALRARLASDVEAEEASGFPALLVELEALVFSRARELKRAACAGRLAEALRAALEAEEALGARVGAEAADEAAAKEALLALGPELLLAVDDALRAYERELDEAFEAAAEEVLAFVRPRATRLSRHGAHPEDRAFLAELLERRLREATDRCERRLVAQLRGRLSPMGKLDGLEERLRPAIAPALAAHWGYQRGVLQGGALRRFFEEVLPRAELEASALVAALARGRVDVRTELRPALVEAVEGLQRALVRDREVRIEALEAERRTTSRRVFAPLRALAEVLGEIAGTPTATPARA